jgi:hypothetical protein
MKHILDPAVFLVESGLLFEINRKVLHPHGIALVVEYPETNIERVQTKETTHTSVCLWDARNDPEGITFSDTTYKDGETKLTVTVETDRGRLRTRRAALGYIIQGCSPDETAKVAYAAYGASTGWVNFMGKPMPKWEDLPEKIQQAWRDATAAVVEP